MTCKQLGGACDKEFTADTFEEIINMSKMHGMEMFTTGDTDHLKAIGEIQKMMQTPEAMQAWMDEKKAIFESLS
tara:strand:- start:1568 stop:1789 length:222 start_codon:yes stop_codon:yes gene_type:complete